LIWLTGAYEDILASVEWQWQHSFESHPFSKPPKSEISQAGLPDFYCFKIPKREKHTKLLQTISNVNKI
jgi:hypothetical protein